MFGPAMLSLILNNGSALHINAREIEAVLFAATGGTGGSVVYMRSGCSYSVTAPDYVVLQIQAEAIARSIGEGIENYMEAAVHMMREQINDPAGMMGLFDRLDTAGRVGDENAQAAAATDATVAPVDAPVAPSQGCASRCGACPACREAQAAADAPAEAKPAVSVTFDLASRKITCNGCGHPARPRDMQCPSCGHPFNDDIVSVGVPAIAGA